MQSTRTLLVLLALVTASLSGAAPPTRGADATFAPDPSTSTVRPVLIGPWDLWWYTVIVRDVVEDPVAGAEVTLQFAGLGNTVVHCDSTPDVTCTTDAAGCASFVLHGGGPSDPSMGGGTVQVWADSILIGEVGVVSPDIYRAGSGPEQGDGSVGLADAVYSHAQFQGLPWSWSMDLNGDGQVGLIDAAIFARYICPAAECDTLGKPEHNTCR